MPSESRTKYYKKNLGRLEETYQIRGGTIEAPFTVLELRDKEKGSKEPGWIYVTSGLSDHAQPAKDSWSSRSDVRIEIMLRTRKKCPQAIKLLAEMANFPFENQSSLERSHVLTTDEVEELHWTGYGLFAAGEGGADLLIPVGGSVGDAQLLLLFPLLASEMELGTALGGKELEKRMLQREVIPYYDEPREPAVTTQELHVGNKESNGSGRDRKQATGERQVERASACPGPLDTTGPRTGDPATESGSTNGTPEGQRGQLKMQRKKMGMDTQLRVQTLEEAREYLERVKSESDALHDQVEAAKKAVLQAEERVEEAAKTVKTGQAQVARLEGSIVVVTGKVDKMTTEYEAVLVRTQNDEFQSVEREVQQARTRIEELEKSIKGRSERLETAAAERQSVEQNKNDVSGRLSGLEQAIKAAQTRADEAAHEALEHSRRAEELLAQATEAAAAADAAAKKARELKDQTGRSRADFEAAKKEQRQLESKLGELEKEIEETRVTVEQESLQKQNDHDSLSGLQAKIKSALEARHEAEERKLAVEEERNKLSAKLASEQQDLDQLMKVHQEAVDAASAARAGLIRVEAEATAKHEDQRRSAQRLRRLELAEAEAARKKALDAQERVHELARALEAARQVADEMLHESELKSQTVTPGDPDDEDEPSDDGESDGLLEKQSSATNRMSTS